MFISYFTIFSAVLPPTGLWVRNVSQIQRWWKWRNLDTLYLMPSQPQKPHRGETQWTKINQAGRISDSKQSMQGYILTYYRLKRENIWHSWILSVTKLSFCMCITTTGKEGVLHQNKGTPPIMILSSLQCFFHQSPSCCNADIPRTVPLWWTETHIHLEFISVLQQAGL